MERPRRRAAPRPLAAAACAAVACAVSGGRGLQAGWCAARPAARAGAPGAGVLARRRGLRHRAVVCRAAPGENAEDAQAVAVVIPGLLYGASSYGELCSDLRARGVAAVAVPMEWWHWIPCLGGRSARPILERIDFAVDHVLAKGAEAEIPWPSYTLADFVGDMLSNPGGVMKVGGSSDPADYPEDVQPRGDDFSAEARSRRGGTAANPAGVSLVGHSAGGWIARVFLSDRAYGGRAYRGAERVGALVTLGTPHASAPSVAYKSIEWLEREEESYTAKVQTVSNDRIENLRKEFADYRRRAEMNMLEMNNHVAELSGELDESQKERQHLEHKVEEATHEDSKHSLYFGQILMSVENLFLRCTTKRKNIQHATTPIIDENEAAKSKEEEGQEVNKDSFRRKKAKAIRELNVILNYLKDFKTITDDIKRERRADPKQQRVAAVLDVEPEVEFVKEKIGGGDRGSQNSGSQVLGAGSTKDMSRQGTTAAGPSATVNYRPGALWQADLGGNLTGLRLPGPG